MTVIIGYAAAFLTTLSVLPQIVAILRTRDTSGVSLFSWIQLWVGVALWSTYGILLKSGPVIISNLITFIFVSVLLISVIYFRRLAGEKII